ncbi:hypothetical protein BofuT4_uP030890.1 [Botrytis cinerea T4]|uniref:Uncharacterized protein n=1 Tax=Botryotinia fuckeliana (strain T4) TaxID=999810 RepID=G2Y9D7_BOTF4|nr:hypothetical protein BofuT4_uP030890.1 [Botrytis cinerea T4]
MSTLFASWMSYLLVWICQTICQLLLPEKLMDLMGLMGLMGLMDLVTQLDYTTLLGA